MGGIGFAISRFLAKEYQAKLILTGRSDIDTSKNRKIKELESFGSEVLYIKTDISASKEVNTLIRQVKEKFRNIHGIFHCAGVIKDALIINKTIDDFKQIIAPKVMGLVFLDKATEHEKLDFFILFSSLAGTFGNAGQCDYAYANSFMDNYADMREKKRKQGDCNGRTLSIGWPLWDEGGMKINTGNLTLLKNTFGLKPLGTNEGLDVLRKGMSLNKNHFIVVKSDHNKMSNQQASGNSVNINKSTPHAGVNDKMTTQKIQDNLINIVHDILKVDKNDVDINKELNNYGFNSLSLVEFTNIINDKYNTEAVPTAFFQFNTISKISKYLLNEYSANIYNYYSNNNNDEETITGLRFINAGDAEHEDVDNNNANKISIVDIIENKNISGHFNKYRNDIQKGIKPDIVEKNIVLDYLDIKLKSSYKAAHLIINTKSAKEIEVLISGTGKTILNLGGMGMVPEHVISLPKKYSDKYRNVTVNPPGSGLSELIDDLCLESMADEIIKALETLKTDWPIHLIGSSFGGMIAQYITAEYAEKISSLTLISSFCEIKTEPFKEKSFSEKIKEDFDTIKDGQIYYNYYLNSSYIHPDALTKYQIMFSEKFSTSDLLPDIKVPTLIIAGTGDKVIGSDESKILSSLIPNSKYIEIQEAGHFPSLTHNKELSELVISFIEEQNEKMWQRETKQS